MNMSNDVKKVINLQIANWTVLYYKFHNYHWFIKGHHFFTLHEKFEELYNEAAEYVDELAERLLALGGRPAGTLQECLSIASVKEAEECENEQQMLETVLSDFTQISSELDRAIELAENEGDSVTADMFIGMQTSIQKHSWMFKAYLQK